MIRKITTKSAAIATLGIDIGKNTFHLIGLDKRGAIVLRERLSRAQAQVRLANLTRGPGGLRRRPSPGSSAAVSWPRCAADGGQVRAPILP